MNNSSVREVDSRCLSVFLDRELMTSVREIVCVEPNVGVRALVNIGEDLVGFELIRELFAGNAQAIITQCIHSIPSLASLRG